MYTWKTSRMRPEGVVAVAGVERPVGVVAEVGVCTMGDARGVGGGLRQAREQHAHGLRPIQNDGRRIRLFNGSSQTRRSDAKYVENREIQLKYLISGALRILFLLVNR